MNYDNCIEGDWNSDGFIIHIGFVIFQNEFPKHRSGKFYKFWKLDIHPKI